ncbi:MAG: chromate transporter [Ruminococcaceae bacterium]|nr:chromate transporter [Oscillospiraceae bacterium]
MKTLFELFLSMFKIGLFTFGGGYAMISILDNEFVVRKKWIESDEFLDLVAIAESTPGPIAINCSTYIGYKKEGFLGSVFATLGMCLPSFTIIFLISLFFDKFLENTWFASAFRGIQICVIYIIFSAGIRMLKKLKKTVFNVVGAALTFIVMVTFSLFSVSFSTIFYILIFAFIGVSVFFVEYMKERQQEKENGK